MDIDRLCHGSTSTHSDNTLPLSDPPYPRPFTEGTPGGVTQNESEAPAASWENPTATLTTEQLRDAQWLPLSATPASSGAASLLADLAARVAALETASPDRKTKRRAAGLTKLNGAIGAIVGGVLRRWKRSEPQAVFRSRTPANFTGSPVAARQFLTAMDGLTSLGFINGSKAIRFFVVSWGPGLDVYQGKAPRYWPSSALLLAATKHGVTPATIATDFTDIIPTKPPAIPKPVQVFAVKQRGKRDKVPLPLERLADQGVRIRQGIEDANAFAARHDVQGCLPPRWYRVFVECPLLGGRWQAAGREGVYQVMPKPERLARITIDGESVAEVDVKASHLSIMHGLLGLPLPEGDPYEFPAVPRAVVKAWITATLGKGSPVSQWAKKATKQDPELLRHAAKEVGRLICDRYPFLRTPAKVVARAAGLDRLSHIGPPERLLTHRLMAIEAQALTGAMEYLRTGRGVLALPVHDSLIVPQSGVGHVGGGFDGAFSHVAKLRVRWTVETAP